MVDRYPKRIVCLTEETVEILYRLGQQDRIVGISGFTVRPAQARKEKPKVSAFLSAKTDKILALEPDLVLGFSDIQADIARDLVKLGVPVYVLNHRSVEEILGIVMQVGALVGANDQATQLLEELEGNIQQAKDLAERNLSRRPRVYFEEWDEPMFCGIRWVSELIGIAGGEDCFAKRAQQSLGKDRIIADPQLVIDAAPDIIIGSWCGKKFRPEKVAARPGWDRIPAVRDGQLHEIKSALILQPGPAALGDGLAALQRIILEWHESTVAKTASEAG